MAALTCCKRVLQIKTTSRFSLAKLRGFNESIVASTTDGIRKLEAHGVPTKQTEVIIKVLNDSLENVAQPFMSKGGMQKYEMIPESNLSKFKSELQSSQEHHFSLLQRETEKHKSDLEKMCSELRSDLECETEKYISGLEKMRSELRYEIDAAGQHLDLNFERGHTWDMMAKQIAETANHTNNIVRDIHGLRAQLKWAKYDVIMGTILSISFVGLATVHIFK